jgi:hypothetical protein
MPFINSMAYTLGPYTNNPLPVSTSGIITNGLTLHYDIANTNSYPGSGTAVTDLTGNGRNATLIGTTSFNATFGGGITTTTGAYFSTIYTLNSSFTVEHVSRFTGSSYWATLWGNEAWNTSRGWLGYISASNTLVFSKGGSFTGYNSINFQQTSTNHYVYTFDIPSSTINVYINNVLRTTSVPVAAPLQPTNNLYFGSRHTNTGTGATDTGIGTYNQMRVYTRALTANEVSTNFNFIKSKFSL